jgi:hypothetical protein
MDFLFHVAFFCTAAAGCCGSWDLTVYSVNIEFRERKKLILNKFLISSNIIISPVPKLHESTWQAIFNKGQRPYAMLKAPVPSITEVKQHWAQSVLGWVTAYKRVNHTKEWLALLLARCCIASWGINPIPLMRDGHWFPQDGSGSPDQSPGEEECTSRAGLLYHSWRLG